MATTAQRTWKCDQTVKTVGWFLAAAPDDVTSKYFKLMVDAEDMPHHWLYKIIEYYRDTRHRRENTIAPKGRVHTKNILAFDPSGTVRDELPARRRAAPITEADFRRVVDHHSSEDVD